MDYFNLRKESMKLEPEFEVVQRPPLINKAYHGNFNVSFGEYYMIEKWGRYQYFDSDWNIKGIASVVRAIDLFNSIPKNPEKYLGVFDLFAFMRNLKEKSDPKGVAQNQVADQINILNNFGISSDRIYPSYCAGGSVRELTKGKYRFDFQIPEDSFSKEAFLESGIPEKNLIPNRTRDTLLSLNLSTGHIAWGYRNEVEVKTKDKLIDVFTIENFMWDPVYDKDKIIGLEPISYTLCLKGVGGLERVYMAMNNLEDIRDIEHLKEFYDALGSKEFYGEYIRALHFIMTDVSQLNISLNKKKKCKEYVNKMIRKIPKDISLDKIKSLLQVHSGSQPWYPELKEGIEPTIEEIAKYRKTKFFRNL